MKIKNIKWDTDNDLEALADLPNEVDVKDIIPKGTCKEEYMYKNGFEMEWFMDDIADWLSDAYGWCVKGFSMGFDKNPNAKDREPDGKFVFRGADVPYYLSKDLHKNNFMIFSVHNEILKDSCGRDYGICITFDDFGETQTIIDMGDSIYELDMFEEPDEYITEAEISSIKDIVEKCVKNNTGYTPIEIVQFEDVFDELEQEEIDR